MIGPTKKTVVYHRGYITAENGFIRDYMHE